VLRVENGTTEDAVLRLYDVSTEVIVRCFFVKAHDSVMLKDIPEGTYGLKYATGLDWLEPGRTARAVQFFHDARKRDRAAFVFPEFLMNLLGYSHLQAGDTEGAITLFKLNTEAYPASANAEDSLSDGYLAAGQKDLAMAAEEKCVELLPADTANAEFKATLVSCKTRERLLPCSRCSKSLTAVVRAITGQTSSFAGDGSPDIYEMRCSVQPLRRTMIFANGWED